MTQEIAGVIPIIKLLIRAVDTRSWGEWSIGSSPHRD